MTTEGKAYKRRVKGVLSRFWSVEENQMDNDKPYLLILRPKFLSIFNKTYGKPKGAKSLFKKIDTSGIIKVVEDAVAEVTKVDDSNHVAVYAVKSEDRENPRVDIELWELDINRIVA